jgi:hypothetical protein
MLRLRLLARALLILPMRCSRCLTDNQHRPIRNRGAGCHRRRARAPRLAASSPGPQNTAAILIEVREASEHRAGARLLPTPGAAPPRDPEEKLVFDTAAATTLNRFRMRACTEAHGVAVNGLRRRSG